MILLASFPRSGNTFMRNIFYEVYGIKSSTYHRQNTYPVDNNFDSFLVVKTHEIPQDVEHLSIEKVIYLVRDGRDALVSIAHHRANIIEPGTEFESNLKEAIIAENGSYFGGWSGNIEQWVSKADLIIRYEDLVSNTEKVLAKIEKLLNLPKGDYSKIPSFENSKKGEYQYGSWKNNNVDDENRRNRTALFFRKGKVNGWKEEMSDEMHDFFWSYHGDTMLKLGYNYDGDKNYCINEDFEFDIKQKIEADNPTRDPQKYSILIEASKIFENGNDGIKRYVVELLKELKNVVLNQNSYWDIDLKVHKRIIPLKQVIFNADKIVREENTKDNNIIFETSNTLQSRLIQLVPSFLKHFLDKYNIHFFHFVYDRMFELSHEFKNWGYNFYKNLLIKTKIKSSQEKITKEYHLLHLTLPQNYKMLLPFSGKLITTIHDLTHISHRNFHTKQNIHNADKGLASVFKYNSRYIAVSNSTKADLINYYGINSDKIDVIYEACDRARINYVVNANQRKLILMKYKIPDDIPFLLCLSTIEPRKNIKNTISAFIQLKEKRPDLKLNIVVAGKKGWLENLDIKDFKNHGQNIITTGFIDEQDLSHIYSEAIAFCYVSFYEGFGLPLLEAMNCGVPVIYGNNSSMGEVVGEGGLAADANNVQDIMEQMERIVIDISLRKELQLKALKQASKFSWRKTAIETLNAYKNAIESEQE